MVIVVALILYAMIVTPKLVSDKRWKDLVVFLSITLTGIAVAGLSALGVDLPKIGSLLTSVFEGIYHQLGIKIPR